MLQPDSAVAVIRLVRAEEAWEPVIFGGMIPLLGIGAVGWLIRYAVKYPPEHNKDLPPDDDPPPPAGFVDDGHEGPLH
jgi:hypothetical protein